MPDTMVQIDNLTKSFGGVRASSDIFLPVERGNSMPSLVRMVQARQRL